MEAQIQQLAGQFAVLSQEHQVAIQQLQAAQQQIAALQPAVAAAHAANICRIKPPKPPVFSGRNREPSPQNWTHQVETYLRASNVDLTAAVSVTYAAGFLADSALTWYRLHLADVARGVALEFVDWEAFKSALTTRFTPISPERTARQRLTTLRQGRSARAYAQEFNLCMIELPEMGEKDRIYRFLEGLQPEIRIHVELKNPKTLAEAIEWAIQTDSLVWQIKKGPKLIGRTPFREITAQETGHVPMELGNVEALGNIEAGKREKPKGFKDHLRCFYCKQLGHFKRECPKHKKRFAHTTNPPRK
jgi:hypothetical protein